MQSQVACFFHSAHRKLVRHPVLMMTIAWLAFAASTLAVPTLNVSPTNFPYNTNDWVNIDLNGITSGSSVNLQLFVDVDRNRLVNSNDVLITQFKLKDGVTNSFGAHIIVCDTNGVADGRIQSRISYHGLIDIAQFWHAIGSYLWQAVYTNGTVITSAVFTVSQPTGSVWISGNVKLLTNSVSMTGRSLPGAMVFFSVHSMLQGVMPAAWTDTNGNFNVYLPAGMSTANVSGVTAVKPDYLSLESMDSGDPLASFMFSQPLTNGANHVGRSLFLLSPMTGWVASVSGTVRDSASNGLPGVIIMMQPGNDGSGMGFGVSKADGTYSIPWLLSPAESFAMTVSPQLNMRGYMGSGAAFVASTSNVTGVDLVCPIATTLARVQVVKSEAAGGIAGAKVNIYGDMIGAETFSFGTNGMCELCLTGVTNAEAGISTDSLKLSRRVCRDNYVAGLTMAASGVYSSVTFTTHPGFVVSGRVYDSMTNTLSGGYVYARLTNDYESLDEGPVDFGGYYELLLMPGTYQAGTWGFGWLGYTDANLADLITVTNQAVSGVNFFLERAALISGRVLGGGNPLEYAEVEAQVIETYPGGGWSTHSVGWASTDTNGDYTVMVPPGTSYVIRAQGPYGSAWLEEYFSNTTEAVSATRVATSLDTPATNINFNLDEGTTISGRVMAGGNPLPDAGIEAMMITFYPGGGWNSEGVAWTSTDADGYYTLVVPPGTSYAVVAHGPYQSVWVDQYYSNASQMASATLVAALIGAPATGVDFDLQAGVIISGRVMADGNPLENANIQAETVTFYPGGGWNSDSVAWANTDAGGYYELLVPPGTSYAVRAQGPYGSIWLEQYFSNAEDMVSATLVTPTTDEPATNIDFHLVAGAIVSGYVSGGGSPIEGVNVQVGTVSFWGGGGGWYWEDSYYGPMTDSSGYYEIVVPPGTNYYVQANPYDGSGWLSQLYSNATDIAQATPVSALTNAPAVNINFHLQEGAMISGRVMGEGNPLSFISVEAGIISNMAGGGWTWSSFGSLTGPDGYYSITVPSGTGYVVHVSAQNSWAGQYYDHAADISSATPVDTFAHAPATGIDFDLVAETLLKVETASLPDGTNGAVYSFQLVASGGQPPYNWYLPDGSMVLPPGIGYTSDGLLYGTPEASGIFEFQVAVYTLSPYEEAYAWLSLTINEEPAPAGTKWSLALGGGPIYYSSPAISTGGIIYVGSGAPFNYTATRGLYAINRGGTQVWEYTGVDMPEMFSPAIDTNGIIYVQDVTSSLHALNPDGSLRWIYPLSRYLPVGQSAPAIAEDGTIYVCAETVYAIRPDGTLKWKNNQLGMSTIRNSPAIAPDGTIYVGANEVGGALAALIPTNGLLKWYCNLPGTDWVLSSPAIGPDGTIYVGSETSGETNYVFAVNTNGTIKWQYDVPGGRTIRSSPAIGVDGTIYIGTKAGAGINAELLALNPDGTLKWSYAMDVADADIYSSPAVGIDGLVYFGAETGYLYALNPDGTPAWSIYTGNGINWSSPAIDYDGTIYIGNNDGILFAVDSSSFGPAESSWPKFRHDSRNTGNWKVISPDGRPEFLSNLASNNIITITWQDPVPGFVLQQNDVLGTTNWIDSMETVNDNGTSCYVTVHSLTNKCFFRLVWP